MRTPDVVFYITSLILSGGIGAVIAIQLNSNHKPKLQQNLNRPSSK